MEVCVCVRVCVCVCVCQMSTNVAVGLLAILPSMLSINTRIAWSKSEGTTAGRKNTTNIHAHVCTKSVWKCVGVGDCVSVYVRWPYPEVQSGSSSQSRLVFVISLSEQLLPWMTPSWLKQAKHVSEGEEETYSNVQTMCMYMYILPRVYLHY